MAKVGENTGMVDVVVGRSDWLMVSCHAYCDVRGGFGGVFGVERCLSEGIGGCCHGCFGYSSELGGCYRRRKVDGSVGQVTRPCLFPLRFLQQVTSLVRVDCPMILFFGCKSKSLIQLLFCDLVDVSQEHK